MHNPLLSRRDAMRALLAISATGALAACGSGGDTEGDAGGSAREVSLSYASDGQFLSREEMGIVSSIADAIIPDTDTPGAVAAGVPAVIQGLASDWGDDDYRRYLRGGLAQLDAMFRREAGQGVGAMSPTMRENVLEKYDARVFAASDEPSDEVESDSYTNAIGEDPEPKDPALLSAANAERDRDNFYKDFKRTVATAYYMSEIGATQELAYEAIPGEWIGDAPLSDYPKTWAT